MAIWQIGTGDSGSRDYTNLFLAHDVMLIGPGDYGRYDDDTKEQYLRLPGREGSQVKNFCEQPRANDVVSARQGHQVVAVGVIPSNAREHQYLTEFDDVLGWDLQHARRVI